MIDLFPHVGDINKIVRNGSTIGYVTNESGASPGLIIEKDEISKSELAYLFRLLDKRDCEQFPERYACCLGFNFYARDVIKYGDQSKCHVGQEVTPVSKNHN